jgi:DNA-binding transcriptional LysR family regulator
MDVYPQHGPVPVGELERGELDVVLGTYGRIAPPLASRELFRERFMCALRKDLLRGGRLTLRRYVELDHLLVANPGYGPGVVDCALRARGLTRRVAMRVPHFLVGPAVIEKADLVLTLPGRVLELTKTSRLRIVRPPLTIPEFGVQLVWHKRVNDDPASTWLRNQIAACGARL